MHTTNTIKEKYILLLKIIFPILVTQIAMYLISFFDIMMSSLYGTKDLAGVSIGSSIWVPIQTGLVGILMAITPIVAQFMGANNERDVKKIVQQGLYMAFVLAILFIALLNIAISPILHMMHIEAEVRYIAEYYIRVISIGALPLFLYSVLRFYIEALSYTKVTMMIILLTVPINIVMNYMFIYGHFGVPAFGGIGAGIGSAVTYWIILGIVLVIVQYKEPFARFHLLRHWVRIDFAEWKEFMIIGVPIGLAIFAETSIFAVITILLGNFSTEIIGAHQIALNFATLLYMVPLSISMGATIVVGFEVGANRIRAAKQYSYLAIGTAVLFSFISIAILFIYREQIARIYTIDAKVLQYATHFLFYAAIFQLSDAVQAPVQGILRGYKDVRVTFMMAIVSYWIIGLPVGYILCHWTHFGPYGYWIGLIIGLATGAITLAWRMRIIEKRYLLENAFENK